MEENRLDLQKREKAVADREGELAGLEEGREARFLELERVREKLALLEKGLETERVDIGKRKVREGGREGEREGERGRKAGSRKCTYFMHSLSRMTIDVRTRTMPGRRTPRFTDQAEVACTNHERPRCF